MNWTALLESEIEGTYRATEGLMRLVEPDRLSWKPGQGHNWMTTGQLLQHLTNACGACCKGFVAGDWGLAMSDGADTAPDDMLPPADRMPSAESVDAALRALAADKELALAMVREAGEEALANRKVPAPWNPEPRPLGQQLLTMVGHLAQHKGQLFYYLKLQGQPVHTGTLWGM